MGVAMKNITEQGCCIQIWSLLWRVLSPTYILSETTDFGCSASMVTVVLPWPPWCSYGDLELKLSADYCDSFRQPSGKYIHSSSFPNFPTHTGPRWPRMCALCLPRISLFSEIHSPAHQVPQQQQDCNAFLKNVLSGNIQCQKYWSKIFPQKCPLWEYSVSMLSSIWRDEDVGACNWPKEEQEV